MRLNRLLSGEEHDMGNSSEPYYVGGQALMSDLNQLATETAVASMLRYRARLWRQRVMFRGTGTIVVLASADKKQYVK